MLKTLNSIFEDMVDGFKEKLLFHSLAAIFVLSFIPSIMFLHYYSIEVPGILIEKDPNITQHKSKSKVYFRYHGTFKFLEDNKTVSLVINESIYKDGVIGNSYNFARSYALETSGKNVMAIFSLFSISGTVSYILVLFLFGLLQAPIYHNNFD